jgi:hypothetical protein
MGFLLVFDVLENPNEREQVVKNGRNKKPTVTAIVWVQPLESVPIANDGDDRPLANEIDEGRASANDDEAENLEPDILIFFSFSMRGYLTPENKWKTKRIPSSGIPFAFLFTDLAGVSTFARVG